MLPLDEHRDALSSVGGSKTALISLARLMARQAAREQLKVKGLSMAREPPKRRSLASTQSERRGDEAP